MAEPTISAGYARALMGLAISKGASRNDLARRSGLDPADLDDQDHRVPFASYVALMRAGQELCGDPALALHFGEAFQIEELSIVGLIGQSCETLADAFAQLGRYSRLIVDLGRVEAADGLVLSRESDGLWLVDTRAIASGFPELIESSFARMVCRSRRGFGGASFVRAVHVTHPPPAYQAEYERIFRAPVVFGSDRNALLTDEAWLTLKAPHPSRYVFGVLSDHADALLAELQASTTVRGQVERLLLPILHTGQAGMEPIAARMGLSRQTLLRRLKGEGATFWGVLDDLRRRLALDYLAGGKTSISETAYLVGFSDAAAFSRAFKRWTGGRPGGRRGT